ncbi:hypothetical protein [Alteribacter natronophilus]|nr:hypothetical protein [Alteribacter natronophilus]
MNKSGQGGIAVDLDYVLETADGRTILGDEIRNRRTVLIFVRHPG